MSAENRYHHGDLPAALLAAVDEIVRDADVSAVSLREAARRAGVSHAAPAHHFGDKAGLLTAFAAQGFAALQGCLVAAGEAAAAAGRPPLFAMGVAYVRFAVEHPGHFAVMFRTELLHADEPGYRSACQDAFAVLMGAVGSARSDLDADDPQVLLAAAGAWSIVHGFATLWLDGSMPEAVSGQSPDAAAGGVLRGFGAALQALGEPTDWTL